MMYYLHFLREQIRRTQYFFTSFTTLSTCSWVASVFIIITLSLLIVLNSTIKEEPSCLGGFHYCCPYVLCDYIFMPMPTQTRLLRFVNQ